MLPDHLFCLPDVHITNNVNVGIVRAVMRAVEGLDVLKGPGADKLEKRKRGRIEG